MSVGGSKPVKPAIQGPTELELQHEKMALEKWRDFERRYLPVEAQLRDRVAVLDSDQAYARAMAAAQRNEALNAGNNAKGAALLRAMGMGGTGATGSMNGAYTSIAQQEAAQRANYLSQAKGVADLGAGISNSAVGSFNSVVGFDRQSANRAFADQQSKNLAATYGRLNTLNEIGNTAAQLGMAWATGGFSAATPKPPAGGA